MDDSFFAGPVSILVRRPIGDEPTWKEKFAGFVQVRSAEGYGVVVFTTKAKASVARNTMGSDEIITATFYQPCELCDFLEFALTLGPTHLVIDPQRLKGKANAVPIERILLLLKGREDW